jgi:Flp pilus assembly protein TadG
MAFSGDWELWPSMPGSIRSTLRRLAAESRGAEIAEAAAVLPLMFMILLGIFWFGQAFSMYGTITRAAQDGVRAGVAPYCTTCTPGSTSLDQNAFNAVQASMSAAKLDVTKAAYPTTTPSFNSCVSGGGSVACDGGITGNTNNVCVQSQVLMSSTPSSGGVCGVSVSFQYPFQFWLPFTSLNKQKIWVTASAHARVENQ